LRKVSLIVAALVAMLSITAVALAANQNTYTVTGKIASGGTKKKPKHVGLTFNYKIATPDGTVTTPVARYKIHFDGLKFNTKGVAKGKYCSAKTINSTEPASDSSCPKGTHVGTGLVKASVGTAGQASAGECNLKLDIYAGGPKSLALYLHGTPPDCIATIGQAIDAKLATDAKGGSLTFDVPPNPLLHPVAGLDAGITSVSSTIVKGSGTKGVFTSTGCTGSRKVEVTFTTEAGEVGTASASAGKC
jgi:hypothetical protein